MSTILIIDDQRAIADALGKFFERDGHTVFHAPTGEEGVARFRSTHPDLVLLDVRLPDISGFDVLARIRETQPVVVMITGHGDVPLAVRAMQEGAENFLTKPLELDHLAAVAGRALEKARLRQLTRFLADRRGWSASKPMLGTSEQMRELAEQIQLVARSDRTTVLILGESGTGKGRVAEAIHAASPRSDEAFVDVSCGSLTAESLDAELFGEERLPDAAQVGVVKRGLLEVADHGTLFLDEIGDVAPNLQPKLLRLLEGTTFRRPGGSREVSVDVRIMAATSRDLVNEVTAGRFREDLYYRLSVMPVSLPPLRARAREDMVGLIGQILDSLQSVVAEAPSALSEDALHRLLGYSWPGNIRELRNVLERAVIMGRGSREIGVAHLPHEVREASGADAGAYVPRTLVDVERLQIERALRAHDHNRTRAARELGIARATLMNKITKYHIDVPERKKDDAVNTGLRSEEQ